MAKIDISKTIFERIARGDELAFAELYNKTHSAVYAFLLSLTHNPEDAKDLLQETYIKLHKSCHMYHDQGTPMAWIMKISKNLFLMKVRKKSEKVTDITDDMDSLKATLGGIEDVETRMWIEQLFTSMSDEERNIIIMHVVMGLKHREIADELGMPIGTVLSKYNRGIKKLQRLADESNEEVR